MATVPLWICFCASGATGHLVENSITPLGSCKFFLCFYYLVFFLCDTTYHLVNRCPMYFVCLLVTTVQSRLFVPSII
jgi:hypothetical protein